MGGVGVPPLHPPSDRLSVGKEVTDRDSSDEGWDITVTSGTSLGLPREDVDGRYLHSHFWITN